MIGNVLLFLGLWTIVYLFLYPDVTRRLFCSHKWLRAWTEDRSCLITDENDQLKLDPAYVTIYICTICGKEKNVRGCEDKSS